jgi:hypothetical protein
MALRAIKPKEVKARKRLKALVFAPAGMGKTTCAIQFPKVYLVDTEKGAENDQYIKLLDDNGGAYWHTTDFDELIKEVQALLSTKHEYKTLVIDPLTVLYNDLLDKAAMKVGTEFGRHYGEANKRMKHLLNLLLRLDLNVIITSHAKNEYGDNLAVLGQTYDCYKKLDYLFDLVFEIQKRGKDRVGVVRKTRVEGFPEGDVFPWSYGELAKRYGADIIEKAADAQELATPEQVAEVNRLVDLLKVEAETVTKWLDKAGAETLAEMPADAIEKCIQFMTNKIKGEKAA